MNLRSADWLGGLAAGLLVRAVVASRCGWIPALASAPARIKRRTMPDESFMTAR